MEIIAPDVTTLWFTRIRPSNFSSRLEFHLVGTVRSRSCLSSLGPDKYDDSDALNDQVSSSATLPFPRHVAFTAIDFVLDPRGPRIPQTVMAKRKNGSVMIAGSASLH
ncbi:unnamed protein product [Strongylus vulgaris]|uniref:Uncharacterized protein n=1 Tax=Strongylus vulgaris TaxID=40348 RepID=A0A3P7KG05_STRVU|nr:unnamed protein product [Strongylus vulgaris]